MFEVIFLVHPRPSQWDAYLSIAKSLKKELELIKGFRDNVRYRSLTQPGWLLSLSDWDNEKALVRWRTQAKHHFAQEKGREMVFQDYHLRIGEVFFDKLCDGDTQTGDIQQDRFDETEAGESKAVTLVNFSLGESEATSLRDCRAESVIEQLRTLGFDGYDRKGELISLDVFEAILSPGSFLLLYGWKNRDSAESASPGNRADRVRHVRVVRNYGMFDRNEAPQYYNEVEKRDQDD